MNYLKHLKLLLVCAIVLMPLEVSLGQQKGGDLTIEPYVFEKLKEREN
jgi:hypothetical protein